MIKAIRNHWPLIIGLIVLWGTIAFLMVSSVKQNQGHLIYTLDDPYIHMAIAKNFAEHGVWGVTKYSFTSSSSSLIWTIILSSAYFLFGVNNYSPFILNLLLGSVSVFMFYSILKKYILSPVTIMLVLFSFIYITPIPYLMFTGQEHILHVLISLLIVYFSVVFLTRQKMVISENIILLLLAMMLTMTRFEGLFMLFIIVILFAIRKRFLYSLLLGFCGALPILIYAVISVSKGWYLLPNSVLLKGNLTTISFDNLLGYRQMIVSPYILMLLIGALSLYVLQSRKQTEFWVISRIINLIFIATTILHIQFARLSLRYDAYLVALGILSISVLLMEFLKEKEAFKFNKKHFPDYLAVIFLAFLFLYPCINRAVSSLNSITKSSKNIYEQQYQMGLFVREFYLNEGVALNDIGAVNYLAEINCLDLWGLSNRDVAQSRLAEVLSEVSIFDKLPFLKALVGAGIFADEGYNKNRIYKLAAQKNVKIALVYDDWYDEYGGLPEQWVKVGEWAIRDNIATGGDYVSLYAIDSSEVSELIQNLKIFSPRLPKAVIQSGEYTGTGVDVSRDAFDTETNSVKEEDDIRSKRRAARSRRGFN